MSEVTNLQLYEDAPATAPTGAVFSCAGCRHSLPLPEELIGRQAKCPHCGLLGLVERPGAQLREPDERDVVLDDLADGDPVPAKPVPAAGAESLALDAIPQPESASGHIRNFFSGSLPQNLLAGLILGAHIGLVCLALALLASSIPGLEAALPNPLVAALLPALLGSVLFALHGRLAVAVGAPDPAAVLCVFLLCGALAADMSGHAPPAAIAATALAAVALASMVSGAAGVMLSRLGLGERSRFLPPEILGGMLAGFGLLLLRAWASLMTLTAPGLSGLFDHPAAELLQALAQGAPDWAPVVGFGLAYFFIRLYFKGLVWSVLAVAVAVGAWNFLVKGGSGPLASIAAQASHLHALAGQGGLALELYLPATLAQVDWAALFGRKEFFAATAVVAILPSLVRVSILESTLARDAGPDEQMRVVGAASMLSGLLGGLPSSLSLSGSLGLRALGAGGPVAGFIAGLACLGLILTGADILQHIPVFVPLGMLLALALLMPVHWLLRDSRNSLTHTSDQRAAWAACLLVVLLGPVLGVFFSVAVGLVLALSRAVSGGGVRQIQNAGIFHSNVDRSPSERRILQERGRQILVVRLQDFLFLGNLHGVLKIVRERAEGAVDMPLRYVLLDFAAVSGLGASSALGFKRLEDVARELGLVVLLTSVPLEMEEHLEGLGYRLADQEGVCRLYLNTDYALEWCEDRILEEAGALVQRQDSMEELLAAAFPDPRLVPTLMKCLERMEAPRKRHIIHQGDPSDAMYFLQSGKVHVELALPGGKVLRLKKMGPGTVFGEMGLYTSAPRSASVIATEHCVVFRLSVARFGLIQAKAPQLAAAVNRFIVTLLADRLAEENAKTRAMQS